MPRLVYPLDPKCPEVAEWHEAFSEDLMMMMSGVVGEFYDEFASRHRTSCRRCTEYGAANVEIDD